jgi:hypothetical protein
VSSLSRIHLLPDLPDVFYMFKVTRRLLPPFAPQTQEIVASRRRLEVDPGLLFALLSTGVTKEPNKG